VQIIQPLKHYIIALGNPLSGGSLIGRENQSRDEQLYYAHAKSLAQVKFSLSLVRGISINVLLCPVSPPLATTYSLQNSHKNRLPIAFKMVKFHSLFMTAAILTCCQPIMACQPDFSVANKTEGYPQVISGTDGPADAATSGFVINHFSLIVNDLAESRYFYGEILGMRHMFTYEASAGLAFMYVTYRSFTLIPIQHI